MTKNGSSSVSDTISYRLNKVVQDLRLGRELIEGVVGHLHAGVIPNPYSKMRVVYIPKLGRDLMLAKNWRPLNLINCVGRLVEKVVPDSITDLGGELFHCLQYGSVQGRSAIDVLYKSVRKARHCIDGGGIVGWGFCDMKGGFQNIVRAEVLERLKGVAGTRALCGSVEQCVSPKEFEVSWDERVRGKGSSAR